MTGFKTIPKSVLFIVKQNENKNINEIYFYKLICYKNYFSLVLLLHKMYLLQMIFFTPSMSK